MKKITIIGGGNIGLSLAEGLVRSVYCSAGQITITRRNLAALAAQKEQGFQVSNDNRSAITDADLVILAVLPGQLNSVMEEISSVLLEGQILVSMVSGVSCQQLLSFIKFPITVIRAMPNTAIAIGESMTCMATQRATQEEIDLVKEVFSSVGQVELIHEDLMTSATALCACGIAFFLRSIRAASQGGVEIGFHAHQALKMAIQTAKGAAELLQLSDGHPETEIDKVTSPNGCTIAGLNEMEHQGFSSSFIKGIKTSKKQAGGLYEE